MRFGLPLLAFLAGTAPLTLPACSSSGSTSPTAPEGTADAAVNTTPADASADAPLTDDAYVAAITSAMHDALLADLVALVSAAKDLEAAAPYTSGQARGWDATADATAITSMKAAWVRARNAYEHVEGAFAPIFPDLDTAIDARYDDFLTELLASGGDADPFDDQGVTGLHGVERILYAPEIPTRVVDFEKALPGYVAARYPATEAEAAAFKQKLAHRVVVDATKLHDQWAPSKINIAIAFQGLISLMNEQREKVTKAASNEEESRYAQRTMADVRLNLEGTTAIYAIFQPWIRSKANATDPSKDGPTIDTKILAGFDALKSAYAAVPGDAIPAPPATWSAENPSDADRATPFGQLYTKVREAVDPTKDGGVVYEMNLAASLLGFPQFAQK